MKLNVKFTIIILVFVFVPIAILSVLFFRDMENNTIQEREKELQYTMASGYEVVRTNVDNINMSTQFFLSDKSLLEYLRKVQKGSDISYEEMMNFYNVNIASLERMVNSNPYIYQIRVFVDSDSMEEMMPILYRYSRMNRLSWANDKNLEGWKFDYYDTTFDSYTMSQNDKLLALVTPIRLYNNMTLGMLEVSIRMNVMFPEVYQENAATKVLFIDEDGTVHCSEDNREPVREYRQQGFLDRLSSTREDGTIIEQKKMDGTPYLVGSLYIRELGGTLVYVDDLQEAVSTLHQNRNLFLGILLLIFLSMSLLIDYVVKRLLAQFYRILQSIREIQKGDLNVEIENCGTDEMGELGTQINKMMERIRQLMEENINRELLAKNSELRALQNQINAHFIYNVLESIKMMAEIDEKYDISDAITALGKLLRYSMRWTSGRVTVEEELDYIQNYLSLINLRFDYEIYLSLNLQDLVLRQEIPKMSLQPIVENAINHGIEQLAEDTSIYVKGYLKDGDCIIEITDAGKGMSQEQVEELHKKINGEMETGGGKGNGIGLKNVQDRIKMNFGENYGLQISSKLGCFTKVSVRIPQTYFGQAKGTS